MDLKIAGRRALVLGGNRGMGLAIAKALHNEGVRVVIAARNAAVLAQAAGNIGGAETFTIDLADSATFPSFADAVGPIDILINNTGGPPYGTVIDRTAQDWDKSFQSMVLSVVKLTDLFLPAMRAAKWGRIITLVSTGAVQPIPVLGISNTLRAGLIAWSKSLATEIAKDGVTANILMPGRVFTERVGLTDEAAAEREGVDVETIRQRSWSQIPMGRYGTPEEIAAVVAFACGATASYLTGSILRVDGGYVRHV
jgi:3-oxoacyl-[acyl-carrier protein] reductase